MKKPMVKAMACALAFTMVVTTPLTASAFDFTSIFSVGKADTATGTGTGTGTDTSGLDNGNEDDNADVVEKVKEVPGGNPVTVIEHKDAVGTSTITTTGTLDSIEGAEDKYIIGVTFDKDVVEIEAGEETEITATVLYSDGTKVKSTDLKNLLVFRKISTKAEGQDLGAGSVAYDKYDWTAGGMDIIKRDTLKVRGIHGGSFYIEAALRTDATSAYKYFDVVAVNVKEYAEDITTVKDFAGYAKHTYSLDDLGLTRTPETSNDNITVTAYELKSNGTAKSTSYVKVNKDNTFTIKEDIPANKTVVVKAVSEKAKIAETQITTKEATPITKMVAKTPANKKVALDFNGWNGLTKEVEVTTYIKKDRKNVEDTENTTTDDITWTTKNANVAIVNGNGKTATIEATGTGKTVVTAKATSGKTVKFNVTVTSDLQEIKAIVDKNGNDNSEVYSGQKVKLTAVKDPENATTKITWSSNNKNIAKVDKNGVVTANSKNKKGEAVITAKFVKKAKDGSKATVTADVKYTLTVKPSELNANKLVLTEDVTYETGKESVKNGSIVADAIYIPRTDDYDVAAQNGEGAATVGESKDIFDTNLLNNIVTWTNSKAKVVDLDDEGIAEALTAGKTKITASVVNVKGETLKAKATITSTQAVTALQTNKTVVNVSPKSNGTIKAVTLKVSKQLPKKATKEALTWEKVEGSNSIDCTPKNNGKANATAKVEFSGANVGDSATFRVTAANGATTTVVVNVVNPTKKVKFAEKTLKPSVGDEVGNLYTMTTIVSGNDEISASDVKAGKVTGYENVEFSVNKKGIVTIDAKGNVYAVKAGTVKITAKTPSGKKAVMTVKVK